MSETISKASVCEILADIYPTDGEKVVAVKEVDKAYEAIQQLSSAQPDNQVNLCDSCTYQYPDCPSKPDDVIFGNGKGNDNICACSRYKASAQSEIVRCKDCVRYGEPECLMAYDEKQWAEDDGFCHAGERGEQDD